MYSKRATRNNSQLKNESDKEFFQRACDYDALLSIHRPRRRKKSTTTKRKEPVKIEEETKDHDDCLPIKKKKMYEQQQELPHAFVPPLPITLSDSFKLARNTYCLYVAGFKVEIETLAENSCIYVRYSNDRGVIFYLQQKLRNVQHITDSFVINTVFYNSDSIKDDIVKEIIYPCFQCQLFKAPVTIVRNKYSEWYSKNKFKF